MGGSPAQRDDEGPAEEAAMRRAAALDDLLGGFGGAAAPVPGAGEAPAAGPAAGSVAGLINTMLLLRQAAAADGVIPLVDRGAAPQTIGRHAILGIAGEGGFATVWEGFDTQLRRPVAVKVRRPELVLSESARRRFVREAEIAARLVHPHIVTIFEVGEDAGREFIAAEFCSGGSLAAWLERNPGPLPPRDAARLVRALASGVAHAHAAGVIHRDIKPANVLLVPAGAGTEPVLPPTKGESRSGAGFSVKLGDFGLGKLQEEEDLVDQLTQLTRGGTTIGTPAWMAPEQVDRTFGSIGPATDVHAMGLLLYRLLTGRALRDGRTDAETYRQVLLDEPLEADQIIRSVPRDLAAVAAKCLAKHPRDRYATAEALATDLDRWLTGQQTVARPLSPVGRTIRWVSRRPVVVGLAAAAIAAGLVASWTGFERIREAGLTAARENDLQRQRAVAELRRGFEALRVGNVAEAIRQLEATRAVDPALADSLAGRWLERRMHGERGILLDAAAVTQRVAGAGTARPRDLYAITLTADGSMAAVAGADGRVHLLRDLSGTPQITSVLAHDEVNAVAFSAEGSLLATAGQDGRLRWWQVTDAGLEPAGETAIGAGPLYAVAFSPDGHSLAIGGEDRVVRLVRLDAPVEPKELFRFEAPPGKSPEVESALFVDDNQLAIACGDQIVLLEATTGKVLREFERGSEHNRNVVLGGLVLAADGQRLAACGTDNTARVWDLGTGKIACSLPAHPAWVQGCAFSADGSQIATVCRDGGTRVFELAGGRLLNHLLGHVGRVWSVAWEPAGSLVTAGADGTVRRWDPGVSFDDASLRTVSPAAPEFLRVIAGPERVPDPDVGVGSAGAGSVFTVDRGGGLWQIAIDRGEARQLRVEQVGHVWQCAYDAGRRRVVVCPPKRGGPRIVSFTGSSERDKHLALPAGVAAADAIACWSPAGELVLRAHDGALLWWPADLAGPRRIGSLGGVVHALQAAPVGPPRVAAIGDRAIVHPLPGSPTDRFDSGSPLVLPLAIETTAVAWSPDAAVIAFGTRTGAVQLFAAANGEPLGSLAPHERAVEDLAFTPDGRILVSVTRDCVRISDAAALITFDELRPAIRIRGMCLTADGSRLVIAGEGDEPGPGRLAIMELGVP
ncbi:MAG: WD40 repeat domain-containing serine/threonine-protein kinase [Planctomycetota bacterium]